MELVFIVDNCHVELVFVVDNWFFFNVLGPSGTVQTIRCWNTGMFPSRKHCWIIWRYFVGWDDPSLHGSRRGRICHGKAGKLWSYERVWNNLGDKTYSERTWLSPLEEDYPPWYQTYVCVIPWGAFWSWLGWGPAGVPGTELGHAALHLWVGGMDNA